MARDLADAGEPSGTVITAEQQTGGRGRHGRQWQSPAGNLYTTTILRPPLPLAATASFSLVAGLAVLEAVAAATGGGLQPRVKWPNDVLVGDAKIAGILLEGAVDANGATSYLTVGIGINVALPPAPPVIGTSLHDHGFAHVTVAAVLDALVSRLSALYDRWVAGGFVDLREEWLARAYRIGGEASVKIGETVVKGHFVDVDEGGTLMIAETSGVIRRIYAGELFFPAEPLKAGPQAR